MNIIQFNGTNCKSCYKCIRNCAIKAIKFKDSQARILDEDCVLCGRCTLVCPQNAKQIFSDLSTVKEMVQGSGKVYVSLAPSYISAFPGVSFAQMSGALKRLGFTGVEETAIGATEVSREYARLLSEKKMKNLITTCCPTVNLLVERYYPSLVPQMAPVAAPASAHAKMMRSLYDSKGKVVFIGPCISKKYEAQQGGAINAVLLFDELREWLEEEGILFDIPDETPAEMHTTLTRVYPIPGGIIRTIPKAARGGYKPMPVDGLGRCMTILQSLMDNEIEGYLLEMSACAGACMEGPGMQRNATPFLLGKDMLMRTVQRKTSTPKPLTEHTHPDIALQFNRSFVRAKEPDEATLQEIYHEIGKYTPESMLNCGACGYSTCEQKAIAVYQGKADLHMCLPYLREKAESLSNLILDNTPHAIFVTDHSLAILEYNRSAQRVFSVGATDMVGYPMEYLIAAPELEQLRDLPGSGPKKGEKVEIYTTYRDPERGLSLELSIVSAENHTDFIVIAKDISSEEKNREQIEKIRQETLETTQKVIDKQMRAAQEIASLLGETTGETKAALSKLKKSILSGDAPL